jgi:hypothetical protein
MGYDEASPDALSRMLVSVGGAGVGEIDGARGRRAVLCMVTLTYMIINLRSFAHARSF